MSGLQLHDLRQVPDETLYLRLIVLRKHFPTDFDAEDYDYRRNVWEAANRAVQAEIRRRRAQPPKWWVLERGEPREARQRRFGAVAAYLVGGGLVVLLSGIPHLAVPLMLTVLASGATWLVPEVWRNQRQPFLQPIPRPRAPRG